MICSTKRQKALTTDQSWEFSMYTTIRECHNDWPDYTAENFFHSYDFLAAIEQCPPTGMRFRYAVVHRGAQWLGFLPYQIAYYDGFQSLVGDLDQKPKGILARLRLAGRKYLARKISFHALVLGTTLLTGEYVAVIGSDIPKEKHADLISSVTSWVAEQLDAQGIHVAVLFSKDYFESTFQDIRAIENHGFHPFQVQPNMILPMQSHWQTPEDYAQELTSKYRVRNKRARKKSIALRKVDLTASDLSQYEDEIFAMYSYISRKARFNLFELDSKHFLHLKQEFPEKFQVVGYFDQEQLIGFYSYFILPESIDAHFLGFHPDGNPRFHIYHNFLLDLIEIGIYHQVKEVELSRTALEIKSSVGAQPHQMYLLIKHRSAFIQRFFPFIFRTLNPSEEWVQRSPFKSQ